MVEQFDALMAHLNSEDNELAAKMRAELVRIQQDELDWLDCLHAAGVDNWAGCAEAQKMYAEGLDDE